MEEMSRRKTMNFVEKLIREVSKRPMLWDRFHNDYNNRIVMDSEWEKIAIMLDKDKDFVKQKWRNLRDQFQREIKKVKVPFDNPTKPYIHYYRGKWLYFENMLFLKDIQLRNRRCFTSSEDTQELQEEEIKEEVIDFDEDIFSEQMHQYNNESDHFDKDYSINSPSPAETGTKAIEPKYEINDISSGDDDIEVITVKRKISEAAEDAASIQDKRSRPSIAEAASNTEETGEIDDDLHFVKSLVPYLRKLTPIRKLLVRNEIQSLLIRESLCENCKFGSSSCHNN